jgi:hypothetical protein
MNARGERCATILLACGLLAAAWLSHASPPASAAQANEAVLVVSFPKSMWINIDGQSKAALVKKAIGRVLPSFEGKLNLGMEVYGSAGSSCEDITKIRDIGPIDPADYLKGLEPLKPKGHAPLAAAINRAAGMFQSDERPRTIIVVTDSLDTCKGDPCGAVNALKQNPGGLTVHVVAFDRWSKEKLKGLSCIAENAKGQFTTAINEAELETALRAAFAAAAGPQENVALQGGSSSQQRLAIALRGGGQLAALPLTAGGDMESGGGGDDGKAAVPDARQTEAPPTSGDPSPVTLTAFLAQGAAPLTSHGLTWRIFEGRARDDGSYHLLHTIREASPTVTLKPGLYLVNASYGKSNLTKRIAVWPGKPFQDDFTLNGGGLRLYATLNKSQVIPDNQVSFDIYSEETDQSGNRLKVIAKGKPGLIFRLNSGVYHVSSGYGDCNATVESDVKVEAGKLAEATFDHDAARMTFRLVDHSGGEALADTAWTIASSTGETVKESAGAFPTHILAAGQYKVIAHHNGAEYAQDFVVKGGETRQVEVVTGAH